MKISESHLMNNKWIAIILVCCCCIASLQGEDALAMSILAAGAVPPEEAIKYVMGLKNVKSVLFGASTKPHVEHTKSLIDKYCQEVCQ